MNTSPGAPRAQTAPVSDRRCPRLRLALLLALAAAPMFAEEKSPPPEDAIAAAKRDLSAIKAATRGVPEDSKPGLSSFAPPELRTGPSAPAPSSGAAATEAQLKAARKSANWLVEAMMKPNEKDARDPRLKLSDNARREHGDAAELDPRLAKETDSTLPADETAPGKNQTPPPGEKKTGPEFNPLTSYMAGWMTPQDYALLKPGLNAAATADLANRGDPSLPVVNADFSALSGAGNSLDLTSTNKPVALTLPKPADNPFLQAFASNSAPAAPVQLAPVASGPTSTSPALVPVPPADAPPARSKVPDFAKPAMDEKYFKQLKRF